MPTATRTSRCPRQPAPSLRHLPGLLISFAPRYLRHFASSPFRTDDGRERPRGPLRALGLRHHIAMYDAVLDLMLRGYEEISGLRLHPATGQAAVKLMHLGFAFDDEFERRTETGDPLSFEEVFGGTRVAGPLRQWQEFMGGFETYPSIRDFLTGFAGRLYADYLRAGELLCESRDFGQLLENAVLDSGGLLVALAEVAGRFSGSPPDEEIIRQFTSLGVTAKLADDMVDFRSDLAAGRLNLLEILARQDDTELARVNQALIAGRRMSAGWWRRNCPRGYARLMEAYERYQATLTSRSLLLASRLMWTPTLVGHQPTADSRGRV
jgi:hypothetical protein